jgi:galactokinase/mevalonate kinase-like predicted kinase
MMRLPVRIDFLGGWSDQECWQGPAAVLNAAVGWDGGYPLTLDDEGRLHSEVTGIGTGLGISSILAAGRFLQANPEGDYVRAVLDWERAQGTCGGWQDQIGGITPGCKLIHRERFGEFTETHLWPEPSFWPHLVLFDTGIRRPSKSIGDRVRSLIGQEGHPFNASLHLNLATAKVLFAMGKELAADAICAEFIDGWRRLVAYVPEMACPVPSPPHTLGHKLCGAGGGGFGLYFVETPEARAEVVSYLRERGHWAAIPELRDGVQFA